MSKYDYPIAVIGAGAGGLVVAIGAAKAGKKVILIERGNYGGDCTNFGCIPSKTLIASGKVAQATRSGQKYGIAFELKNFTASKALKRVQDTVEGIRSHEDPAALNALGVDAVTGTAQFLDKHTLDIHLLDGTRKKVTAANIVIATGSAPRLPNIEGLESIDVLTNENVFELQEIPSHLIVLGGGPIGCELAQAFCRLGAKVSVVEYGSHLLPREEEETQEVIEHTFGAHGIDLHLRCMGEKVERDGEKLILTIRNRDSDLIDEIKASHLLVAVGRQPNTSRLHLEAADVQVEKGHIKVDKFGRTTTKNIWAVGDVADFLYFTHLAENRARAVLTSLLLPGPLKKKIDLDQLIPRVTFTDPEVASVGVSQAQAEKEYGARKIAVYHVPMSEVDRAITDGRKEGFVKVVTKKWSSRILGATIVAPCAGEIVGELLVAIHTKTPLRKLASIIHPYPTYSLSLRKAADKWLTETILPSLKRIVTKG